MCALLALERDSLPTVDEGGSSLAACSRISNVSAVPPPCGTRNRSPVPQPSCPLPGRGCSWHVAQVAQPGSEATSRRLALGSPAPGAGTPVSWEGAETAVGGQGQDWGSSTPLPPCPALTSSDATPTLEKGGSRGCLRPSRPAGLWLLSILSSVPAPRCFDLGSESVALSGRSPG